MSASIRRVLAAISLFLAASAPAADALGTLQVTSSDPLLQPWNWRRFDGLTGVTGHLHQVFEDRDGAIWFATSKGAQRYDGHRWTTYTTEDGLVYQHVNSIAQTGDGAMWFGTERGISRLDGDRWTSWKAADGLAGNVARSLLAARDRLGDFPRLGRHDGAGRWHQPF